ncbi:MAG: hypothetical protein ABIP21_04080 [Acidimicrobiia bacterium]
MAKRSESARRSNIADVTFVAKGDTRADLTRRWFGSSPRAAVGTIVGLLVVGALIPLAVASRAGALDIPRSDDWSYLLTLFRWVDHGRLGFNNWVSMTLVGQLVLTVPIVAIFGRSIEAVHIFSALLGAVGLGALVVIGTMILPARRGAVLVAITIALGPLWAPLAATYMTDVPAFTVQMVSLAFGVAAVRGERISLGLLGIALATGGLAVSIRQYELIPLIALLAVAGWKSVQDHDARSTRRIALMGGAALVSIVALFAWFASLPDALSLSPDPQTSGLAANLVVQSAGFVRLAGVLLIPVVIWGGPLNVVRRAWASAPRLASVIAVLGSVWMTVSYARNPATPFVGNYLDRHGVLAEDVLNGRRLLVIPAYLFDALALAGSVVAVLLLLAAVPGAIRLRSHIANRTTRLIDPGVALLALTVLGFSTAYVIAIATKLPIFDRYALPVIPLVGLLFLGALRTTVDSSATHATPTRTVTRTRFAATVVASIAMALVGLAFSTDSASFDATRWRVDTDVTRLGYSPLAIDGGFEWVSYHRRVGPTLASTVAERQRLRKIYFRGLCIDVRVNPQPRVARHAIARSTMRGLGHRPVLVVAVPNERRCAGGRPTPSGPVK